MKQVAQSLRLDLAAYRELEAFAQMGTELDKGTQLRLDRGARMVELLKQVQYVPLDVVGQIISIFSAIGVFEGEPKTASLDSIPVKEVLPFQSKLLTYIRETHPEIRDSIREEGKITGDNKERLDNVLEDFTSAWVKGTPLEPRSNPDGKKKKKKKKETAA